MPSIPAADEPPPDPPRNVIDWYRGAIAVLERCTARVQTMDAPVVQHDLAMALKLARELVRIHEPNAR